MVKRLFIGGAADGRWAESSNEAAYRYDQHIDPQVRRLAPADADTVQKTYYDLRQIVIDDAYVDVWIERGTAPSEALRRLLEGYRGKRA